MKNTAKVLLIEKNCAQLIALTVWLKQFPEMHVHGTMFEKDFRESVDQSSAINYDLIIYGLETADGEEIPLELAMALSLIRKINAKAIRPLIILLTHHLICTPRNHITSQMFQQLQKESDGQICWSDSLRDSHQTITRLLSQRQAVNIITAKAG